MTEDFAKITVGQWMENHHEMPVIVPPDASIKDVANLFIATGSRDAYIIDKTKRVIGHLGFGKVINHLFSDHRPIHTHRQLFARITDPTAGELMDPHFAYTRGNEVLCEVIHRQLERDVDDLVVLADDDTLLGSIKLRALVTESLL